jgi:rare lipoprotein A
MPWSRNALFALTGAMMGAAACGDRATVRDAAPADAAPTERVIRIIHGIAIWYGPGWHGKRTASGERFDRHALTAAHRELPLGTRARVTVLDTKRQVTVRINDRGPYGRNRRRILDLSEAAARELGIIEQGSARVMIEVLAPPPDAGPGVEAEGDAGPGTAPGVAPAK